jgi:nitrogen fixation/metabolism regulation signal transduction histidine kinase
LADTLRDERLGSLEATAMLRTVMSEIDVAVFAFDDEHKLRLVNRAGERLLGRPWSSCLGGPRTKSACQRVSTAARRGY